jgi:hypothetical protein
MTQDSELLYRSNLEGVCEYIHNTYGDGRKTLNIKDVSQYMGQCYRTVKKRFFKKSSTVITAESFARMISKL